ncbi:unnamed protein product, partial [Prorocentrum cordatum]
VQLATCEGLPSCSDACVPRDCELEDWSGWKAMGSCSGLCERKRRVNTSNNECGAPCEGALSETSARPECLQSSCAVEDRNCTWDAWEDWAPCASKSAQSFRSRRAKTEQSGRGESCTGGWNETRPCGGPEPVDCVLTASGPPAARAAAEAWGAQRPRGLAACELCGACAAAEAIAIPRRRSVELQCQTEACGGGRPDAGPKTLESFPRRGSRRRSSASPCRPPSPDVAASGDWSLAVTASVQVSAGGWTTGEGGRAGRPWAGAAAVQATIAGVVASPMLARPAPVATRELPEGSKLSSETRTAVDVLGEREDLTASPPTAPEEGFDSQYKVDESSYIGTGKFAVVHLCWRRHNPEQRFALKVINTRVGDQASMNRIREEISILQVLRAHPGLVSLVDVDETLPGSIRLVLELCEGGELYDRIQQKQYYPEQEAKACCYNLLDAIAYIHGKGVMHRDLKPENILLASKVSNTDVKISDFGLAKMSRDYPRRLPRSHSICGSDFYLAPEVIKQEEYGREIDIWAVPAARSGPPPWPMVRFCPPPTVGVIAYVLLSGSLPFFHNVLHKLYRQIVERDLSFPEQAWKNVSKGAQDFILRMLQVRPGDRLTADQALSHPFLRGTNGGTSFNSVDSHNPLVRGGSQPGAGAPANYFSAAYGNAAAPPAGPPQGPDAHRGWAPPTSAHPLEHAHNVNSRGNPRPTEQPYQGQPPGFAREFSGPPPGTGPAHGRGPQEAYGPPPGQGYGRPPPGGPAVPAGYY